MPNPNVGLNPANAARVCGTLAKDGSGNVNIWSMPSDPESANFESIFRTSVGFRCDNAVQDDIIYGAYTYNYGYVCVVYDNAYESGNYIYKYYLSNCRQMSNMACIYNMYFDDGTGRCAACPNAGKTPTTTQMWNTNKTNCYISGGTGYTDTNGTYDIVGDCYWSES